MYNSLLNLQSLYVAAYIFLWMVWNEIYGMNFLNTKFPSVATISIQIPYCSSLDYIN
jgi:hypothetical protein